MSNVPTRVGDYEVIGLLGSGGMGTVYKVRNVLSDRVEAMKVLLPNIGAQKELAERFLREIKLLASLDNPNIAALRTAFTFNDQLVMIMEYVEGMTLASRIERGRIAPAEALDCIDQVLSALQYAHSRDIIHRDVKPANMMITPTGTVKVMDFGIARSANDQALTTTGTTLGSLYYMSPEQIRGVDVDCRSDLYSVGVSLYEMLTAQRPFQGPSEFSLMSAALKEEPKPPIEIFQELPRTLNDLVLTAMRKDPAQRFQTATAFRSAVSGVRSEISSVASVQNSFAIPTVGPPSSATSLMQDAPIGAEVGHVQSTHIPGSLNTAATSSQVANRPASSQRTKWALLAGVLLIAGLVAAGVFAPRQSKFHADNAPKGDSDSAAPSKGDDQTMRDNAPPAAGTSPDTSIPSASATQNPANSVVREPDSAVSPRGSASTSPPVGRAKVNVLQRQKLGTPPRNAESAGPSREARQSAIETLSANSEDVEHDMDQLSSRAAAVQSSLDNLQRQQNAQGTGLRGDMAASQERMNIFMAKAQESMRTGDAKSAKKYMELADGEIEKLEAFLGH